MKKILALFLAVLTLLFFVACNATENPAKAPDDELDLGNVEDVEEVEDVYASISNIDELWELVDAQIPLDSTAFLEFDDRDYINKDTYRSYCNTNEALLRKTAEIKGIVVELPGLGGDSCFGGSTGMNTYTTEFTSRCAENGIIVVYMFPGPWSWGNSASVRMTDAVVTALVDKYALAEDFSLAVYGGSMGGLGALIYATDTRYQSNLVGVAAACPCIDVIDRLLASKSYPRTFISAVASYNMPLEDALKTISPAHRIDDMPKVPYFICSDGADEVFPEEQCNEYVDDLVAKGHSVSYEKQPGLKHGQFTSEVKAKFFDFIVSEILDGEEEFAPEYVKSDADLTMISATLISPTELKVVFSESVEIIGSPFVCLRLVNPTPGHGVTKGDIDGKSVHLQYTGSYAFDDDAHTTIIWKLSTPNFSGSDTLNQIINLEGKLYGLDRVAKFCIEEVSKENGENVNKLPGFIDNVRSATDPDKYLKSAHTMQKAWEGAYVGITVPQ